MNQEQQRLLSYQYLRSGDIYLKALRPFASDSAEATFIFGHNPRTSDYTHVGAAEMLAGLSQAAYCMTLARYPELLSEDNIKRCYLSEINVTFSKMLAPGAESSLRVQIGLNSLGLPCFNFEGFINGSVDCGLAPNTGFKEGQADTSSLTNSAKNTLLNFYNNGSELTLKSINNTGQRSWATQSTFAPDSRLKMRNYLTTTQIIVGLSQVAFAVIGESRSNGSVMQEWSIDEFQRSMGDQALVKLSYRREQKTDLALTLENRLNAAKTLKGSKFIRLGLSGDIQGTMDTMLSPRIPIRTQPQNARLPN